jgi:hypothetical protein
MAKRTTTTTTKTGLLKEMNSKIMKLYSQAFKMVPGSARQKKVTEEIDQLVKLRDKLKNNK